jgi:hypothetical protein
MGEVSTIGLDIAKSVFQVHGVDGSGAVVIRKRVSRLKLLEFFAGSDPDAETLQFLAEAWKAAYAKAKALGWLT